MTTRPRQNCEVPVEGLRATVVWRGDPNRGSSYRGGGDRYQVIIESLSAHGVHAEPFVYLDSEVDRARDTLSSSDCVVVWADPIGVDGDRIVLDELLRQLAQRGVRVYTDPDTIQKMGTKDVLFDTRTMSWSSDVHRYDDVESFRRQFADQLRAGLPRVLKQHRGNGGLGVWKVERLDGPSPSIDDREPTVRVQHAAPRGHEFEELSYAELIARMEPYFAGSGHLIDQEFAPRIVDGMVRAYMVKDRVVGFARQFASEIASDVRHLVFGLPSAKTMLEASDREFARLREQLEHEWIPELQGLLDVSYPELPLLWDADFLFGPRDSDGHDSYRLCEINVSCVSPFPAAAPNEMARALLRECSLR